MIPADGHDRSAARLLARPGPAGSMAGHEPDPGTAHVACPGYAPSRSVPTDTAHHPDLGRAQPWVRHRPRLRRAHRRRGRYRRRRVGHVRATLTEVATALAALTGEPTRSRNRKEASMTALADSPTAQHGRGAYRGPGGAGTARSRSPVRSFRRTGPGTGAFRDRSKAVRCTSPGTTAPACIHHSAIAARPPTKTTTTKNVRQVA
jgi:hypothetical protein